MANFIQKQKNEGINSVVLNVSAATPPYLFLAGPGNTRKTVPEHLTES